MDRYLLIPFLGGWTSIYQLFWCSPGVQGFDTLPYNHWHQERVSVFPIEFRPVIPQWYHNWTSNGCPHGVVSRARNHVMPKLNENAIKSWCFPWYQLNIKHHCWMVKVNGFIVFFLPPFWGMNPNDELLIFGALKPPSSVVFFLWFWTPEDVMMMRTPWLSVLFFHNMFLYIYTIWKHHCL